MILLGKTQAWLLHIRILILGQLVKLISPFYIDEFFITHVKMFSAATVTKEICSICTIHHAQTMLLTKSSVCNIAIPKLICIFFHFYSTSKFVKKQGKKSKKNY